MVLFLRSTARKLTDAWVVLIRSGLHGWFVAPPSGSPIADPAGTSTGPARIAPATSGALVDGVVCGTAAAAAGLKAGDVITGFCGHPVSSAAALSALLRRYRPGTRGLLTWISVQGGSYSSLVTLGLGPAR